MCALLNKADAEEIEADFTAATIHDEELERILLIYTDTVQKAYDDLGPQHIVNYLLLLTRAFNSLYARETFVDGDKKESGYYVALTYATRNVLAHGLNLLGIIAPERM
jgi:arginyl-tRNA synthetase